MLVNRALSSFVPHLHQPQHCTCLLALHFGVTGFLTHIAAIWSMGKLVLCSCCQKVVTLRQCCGFAQVYTPSDYFEICNEQEFAGDGGTVALFLWLLSGR